jgi:hypothetical protein
LGRNQQNRNIWKYRRKSTQVDFSIHCPKGNRSRGKMERGWKDGKYGKRLERWKEGEMRRILEGPKGILFT